jgi:hypothetical protein
MSNTLFLRSVRNIGLEPTTKFLRTSRNVSGGSFVTKPIVVRHAFRRKLHNDHLISKGSSESNNPASIGTYVASNGIGIDLPPTGLFGPQILDPAAITTTPSSFPKISETVHNGHAFDYEACISRVLTQKKEDKVCFF